MTDQRTRTDSILGDPPPREPILGPLSDLEPIFGPTAATKVREPEPSIEPEGPPEPEVEAEAPAPEAEPEPEPRASDSASLGARLHAVARGCLTAAVFLVPVVFDPRTIDVFNLTKLTTLWVLTVLAAGLWAAGVVADRGAPGLVQALRGSWIVRLTLGLLAVGSVATVLSSARVLSLHGLYHRYEGLVSFVLYAALVVLVVALYRRRPAALRELAAAVGAASFVVSAYVVLQQLGIDFESWQQVSGGAPDLPIGNLGHAAITGSFLGIAVPFVAYLTWSARTWSRRFAWAVGALFVFAGLGFTQSRPGIVAAGFGVLAMAVFAVRGAAPRERVALVAAALLVAAAAPLVVPGIVGPRAPARLADTRAGVAADRAHPWDAAWRMTVDRPVLGWGPETFFGNYATYRSATEAREKGLSITDKPHNVFLGWATSTGFVGLLGYLALAGWVLWLLATRTSSLDRSRRALALCFGGGFVAYLAQGLYSIDVPPLALGGWLCLGALAVLLEPEPPADESGEPQARATDSGRGNAVAWCVVGVVALGLVAVGVRPLRADHAAWAAEERASFGWSQETMALYEKAASLDPFEAAYKGLGAFYLERVAGIQAAPFRREDALRRAAALYEEARALQPHNVFFMINAARVYASLGSDTDVRYFADADRWLGRALVIDPLDPQLHDLYADLLSQWAVAIEGGGERDEIEQRARTQALIAQQLREGRPVR